MVEEIKQTEGEDIQDHMLNMRRTWYTTFRGDFGKIPDKVDLFYKRNDLETPLSPEEEEKKLAEEEEKAKKKDKKKKDGKKDKGKKKKGGDDDVKEKPLIIGPTECVLRFDEFYEDYT